MNQKDFDALLQDIIKDTTETLGLKGKEYGFGDRLHNFKTAAIHAKNTPEQALWGMAMKHLVSVEDLIEGRLENTRKNVREKIGDLRNYLILLEAVLEDTRALTD